MKRSNRHALASESEDSTIAEKMKHCPETSRINQLPDDVLHLILSFLTTLAEIARTSILSRRWRNVWHNIDCLDFDATTALSEERLEKSNDWYTESVNKVIDARIAKPGLPLVKDLRIRCKLDASQGCHIDRWINFAIANRVETLHLEFNPFLGLVSREKQYILSEETWRRAPSGLSNIKFLKSLFLACVNVSKQFIEFILSSCPLLEDLLLDFAGTCNDLDVSGVPPLRLKRLKINAIDESALAKLCAPYLTSFYYISSKFYPEKIDVPMLTDLSVGGIEGISDPLRIMNYLEPFWSYLGQLEKLYLILQTRRQFKLKLQKMPNLVKLKYLKMRFDCDTDPISDRIVRFIDACPVLETFAFEIFDGDMIRRRPLSIRQKGGIQTQQQPKVNSYEHLKVLEVYGGDEKAIDQVVVKCIVGKAPNLEKLIIDTRGSGPYDFMMTSTSEILEAVKAKAKKLCRRSPLEIEISVIG